VAVDVALPAHEQIRFQAALSLDPAMWQAPTGDGVRYQVLVGPRPAGAPSAGPASLDDAGAVVLDRQVNPRADSEVRRWVPVVADLSPWAGTTVRVTLRTLPREDLTYDWSGWANPVVEVFDAARDRPPAS
jgi:hypothetical protein